MSCTYCVVFLFCFSSTCVPCVSSFSGLSNCIAPSVFSNVYLYTPSFNFTFVISFDRVSLQKTFKYVKFAIYMTISQISNKDGHLSKYKDFNDHKQPDRNIKI